MEASSSRRQQTVMPALGQCFPAAFGDHDRTRRTGRNHAIPYLDPDKRRAAQRAAHAKRMTESEYRERYNSYHREYRELRPQANRRRDHRSLYGLSRVTYDQMVMLQCGACAICGRVPSEDPEANPKTGALVVDHDHATGGIRDSLCTKCNLMCGQSGDNAERLDAAAKYLREWGPTRDNSWKAQC